MNQKPKLSKHVKFRDEGGWALISDMQNGTIYRTNSTGYFVLMQLDGLHSVDEIIKNLAQMFEKNRKEVKEDVLTFLRKISSKGFIDPAFT